MELTSKTVNIQALNSVIFNMLCNCNNIAKYIPSDKIQNWQSTEDSCSFTVEGAGKIEMSIQEKIPYSSVSYTIGNNITKAASIVFSISKTDEQSCELEAKASLDVPFFMAQMLKSSLQRFMDMLVDYIKIAAEKAN
jgi:hypothetical protein